MFSAHVSKKLCGWAGAASLHIFIALTNTLHCVSIILPFPLQVNGQRVIQRGCGVLTVPAGVFLELCFTFGLEGYHVHKK